MKQTLIEIANILWKEPKMNEEQVMLIINPLDTEEEAKEFLEFLENNKEELTIQQLIKKALEIAGKN